MQRLGRHHSPGLMSRLQLPGLLLTIIILPLCIATVLQYMAVPESIQRLLQLRPSYSQQRVKAMADTQLYKIIASGAFWSLPDDEVLTTIRDTFPAELDRLKNAYSLRPNLGPDQQPLTPSTDISTRLFGKKYPEINRTLVGILALRWIWNGDYDTFVGQHNGSVRLKLVSFNWLQDLFKIGLSTHDDTFTLVVSMITNDLGKDPKLASDYAELKGIDISKVNHDKILQHAVEAGMVPALDLLPPEHRENVKTGMRLGAEFNFGQLAQGENAPASLSGLQKMKGQDKVFQMRFMEQVLDLAGAAGHEDWTSASKMIEPVFQSYKNVHDVATGIISGAYDVRFGYDIILTRKQLFLKKAGFTKEFDVKHPEGRTMLRLFCLGNANTIQLANMYDTAFNKQLSPEARKALVHALNVDGSVDEPAVQPTYAPAMFTKACNNVRAGTTTPVDTITAMMEYLARVMTISKEELANLSNGGEMKVTVVERNIRCVESIVSGQDFRHMPRVLAEQPIPEAQIANVE